MTSGDTVQELWLSRRRQNGRSILRTVRVCTTAVLHVSIRSSTSGITYTEYAS